MLCHCWSELRRTLHILTLCLHAHRLCNTGQLCVLCLCLFCTLLLSIAILVRSVLSPTVRLIASKVVITMHKFCFSASVASYIEVVVTVCAVTVTAFRLNWFRRRMLPYRKGSFCIKPWLVPIGDRHAPLPRPYFHVETCIQLQLHFASFILKTVTLLYTETGQFHHMVQLNPVKTCWDVWSCSWIVLQVCAVKICTSFYRNDCCLRPPRQT